MKKILLIISIFFISLGNIDAQSGFIQNRYYQQQYHISYERVSWNTYTEVDRNGHIYHYEKWRKAKWYSYQGSSTYYYWNGNFWATNNQWGNYWYYRWQNYKRYFYYWNGRKYYKN